MCVFACTCAYVCMRERGSGCSCKRFFPLSKKMVKSPLVGCLGGEFYDFGPAAALVMALKSKKINKCCNSQQRASHLRCGGRERQRLFIHTLGKCTAEQNAGRQAWGSCMNNSAALPQWALDSHPPPQHPRFPRTHGGLAQQLSLVALKRDPEVTVRKSQVVKC